MVVGQRVGGPAFELRTKRRNSSQADAGLDRRRLQVSVDR
jgi:hypothetical protein